MSGREESGVSGWEGGGVSGWEGEVSGVSGWEGGVFNNKEYLMLCDSLSCLWFCL